MKKLEYVENAFVPEHRGRRTVGPKPTKKQLLQSAQDRDGQWESLVTFSKFVYGHLALHHENYFISAVLPVIGADGTPKQVSGANWTPTKESQPRRCGEIGALRSLVSGDTIGGVLLLRGPEKERVQKKPIQGTKALDVIQPCLPCRPKLALISPELVIVTFEGMNDEPSSARSLGEIIRHQDEDGPLAPLFPEGYGSPLEFAKEALAHQFPLENPQRFRRLVMAPVFNPSEVPQSS